MCVNKSLIIIKKLKKSTSETSKVYTNEFNCIYERIIIKEIEKSNQNVTLKSKSL